PAPSPTPSVPRELSWQSIRLPVASGERIEAVAASADRFVAVGQRCPKGDIYHCPEPIGMAWTSTAGTAWVAPRLAPPLHIALVGVASIADGFLAIGDVPRTGRWRRVALKSADGRAWHEVATVGLSPGSPCTADAEGSPSVLCFGGSIQVGPRLLALSGSSISLSTDGAHWRTVDWSKLNEFRSPNGGFAVPLLASGPEGLVGIWNEEAPNQSEYVVVEQTR